MTDSELLQQYAQTGSQEAFAELVAHHSDWIYSAALRLVGRRDWAEDVTQAVFLLLAQRGKNLTTATLNGWLFKVTRYCALNLLREENRREKRERRAAIMNVQTRQTATESSWEDIAPILEQTVARLKTTDRDAVLLRFYQRKSMAEVGDVLGISEDAARKRVAKALEKLRSLLSVHRVLLPAAGAGFKLLYEHTTQAAPPGIGASCLPGTATAAATNIARGVNRMLFALKLKLAALVMIAMALIPAGVWFGLHVAAAQQSVAPATPMATEVSTLPVSVSVADDAAIAPFYNSTTQAIISINFSQINLDALATELKTLLLANLGPGDPRRNSIDREIEQTRRRIADRSSALARVGIAHMYPILSEPAPRNISGFFVFPIDANSNVAALDQLMKQPASNTPDGKARVYGAKSKAPVVQQLVAGEKRPEFADAMADQPDAAVRIVMNPGFRQEMTGGISTPRTLGLGDMSEPQWNRVKWYRLTFTAPPDLSATLVMQCADADGALAVSNLLSSKFTALHANPPAEAVPAQVASLIGDVKPTVSGSTVTINFDQKIAGPILLDWYLVSVSPKMTHNKPNPQPATDGGL